MAAKITAVVVTYNRKVLLERCLRAVLQQTRLPDAVLILDNASTDGTEDHLRHRDLLDRAPLRYERLSENTGGAGGFSEGLRRAFAAGADYFWLMDDDGAPDPDCLEKLLRVADGRTIHYAAPNLVAEDGVSHFARLIAAAGTDVIGFRGGPFNGILISRALVRAIGYPMKNYFIWGDEYEYTNRMQDAGFPLVMVASAIHRHKSTKYSFSRCPRPYHLVRNGIFSIRLSRGLYVSRRVQQLQLAQVVARLIVGGLIVLNFRQVALVLRGIRDGIGTSLDAAMNECEWGGLRSPPAEHTDP